VTALVALGPSSHLTTRVVRSGTTVTIVGAGDHSLTRRPATLGGVPTASLAGLADDTAAALKKAGVTSAQVHYDASLFTGPAVAPSWGSALLAVGEVAPVTALSVDEGRVSPGGQSRVADPARSAARSFAAALVARGIAVRGEVARGRAPSGAVEVAAGRSPSIATLVEHTLTVSDNDMAEALAHLAGGVLGGGASFSGGAAATSKVLGALGVPTTGMKLSDGSGLSRSDQVSPMTLAAALTAVATHQEPQDMPTTGVTTWPTATGLPVAGLTGTLSDRFSGADMRAALGVVRAKTGTLTGVVGLAGLVRDRDGRLLSFGFLAGGVASLDRGRTALDRASAALARCGCR
jgi:D-alanyl-D-alanine carboxypeptidase/D-alanyl-D-alanine-endopeptidase (penicillin-binding protein 4)